MTRVDQESAPPNQ